MDAELPIDPDLVGDASAPSSTHRPGHADRRRLRSGVLAAIGVGGFIGTVARYEVGLSWPVRAGTFPASTFAINTSGAFAIGVVLTLILGSAVPHRLGRPLLVVGLLGGWTTMSTLATETSVLVKGGRPGTALANSGATLVAGTVATLVGRQAAIVTSGGR